MKSVCFLLGLLALACLCSPGSCFLFHIFEDPAPERLFEIEELLIGVSAFPADWRVASPAAPEPHYDGAITTQREDIQIGFKANSPALLVAGHRVYRFGASWKAAAAYSEQLPVQFNSNSVASLTPWESPEELPFESAVADQFHFACHVDAIGTPATVCLAMGQYQEYLVLFHTIMDTDYMTFADLERILVAVDERMALYLGKDTH
jgi:hypothetical protein